MSNSAPPAQIGSGRLARAASVLLLLIWAGWLAYELLAFGPHSYLRKHDTAEQSTAHYLALGELAERGHLGYWHPEAATGVDALANIKTEQPLIEALFRYLPHWSDLPGLFRTT